MRDEVADTPQGVIKLKDSKPQGFVTLSSLIAAALIPAFGVRIEAS